jgi:predicted nucleotide-binding protein
VTNNPGGEASYLRAIPAGEQWLIDRVAAGFLTTGEWPKHTALRREAARADVELPRMLAVPATDFLWRLDTEDSVVLSIAGFARAASGATFVEQFVRVVLLCRDIYLGDDEDPPKVTSEELRTRLGFDDETTARIYVMLRFEYYVTASGGARTPGDWYYEIADTVRRFKGVTSVEEFFAIRAEIVRPVEMWKTPPVLDPGFAEPEEFDVPGLVEEMTSRPEAPDAGEVSRQVDNSGALPDPRNVFVIHGRDLATKSAMCAYLEALDLHPLDWDEMVQSLGEGTPFTGRVIEHGFSIAQAFVVLMTPEDEARLHEDLHDANEPEYERELTCQPRPNVIFEAGMAFGAHAERTVMVHVGSLRPVSDLAGRNVVNLGPTKAPLLALARRLKAAGCPVDLGAVDAFDPSRFSGLGSLSRTARPPDGVARGRILLRPAAASSPRLGVTLHQRGRNDRLLEIANRGQVTLNDVEWDTVDPAPNWAFVNSVLPVYPIPSLDPRQHVRVPVSISMGGSVYVDLRVRAKTAEGEPFETIEHLSVYG